MQSEYAVKTEGIQQKSQTCKSNRRFLFERVQQKFDEAGLGNDELKRNWKNILKNILDFSSD